MCPKGKLNNSKEKRFITDKCTKQLKFFKVDSFRVGNPAPVFFPDAERTLEGVDGNVLQAPCRHFFDDFQSLKMVVLEFNS